MATPSRLTPTSSPFTVSPRVHQRLERDLMFELTRLGSLPIRRATQTQDGVLHGDGPDAEALRTLALAWVRGQLRQNRHPRHALRALQMALSHMTPADVAAWLLGYLATTPHLVP